MPEFFPSFCLPVSDVIILNIAERNKDILRGFSEILPEISLFSVFYDIMRINALIRSPLTPLLIVKNGTDVNLETFKKQILDSFLRIAYDEIRNSDVSVRRLSEVPGSRKTEEIARKGHPADVLFVSLEDVYDYIPD